MATASPKIPPMPDASIPLVQQDGKMSPAWYQWLKQFVEIAKTVRSEV
jgi:hypothetical protein